MSGAPAVVSLADLIFRDVNVRGFWVKRWLDTTPRAEIAATYARLAALVADGALRAPVAATYPLEQYRDALVHATQAGRAGKVLFAWWAGIARSPTEAGVHFGSEFLGGEEVVVPSGVVLGARVGSHHDLAVAIDEVQEGHGAQLAAAAASGSD